MKTINITEFRNNMKRYLDVAKREKLIIHRAKGDSFAIIPLSEVKETEKTFKSETLRDLIDKAKEDRREGRTIRLTPELRKELFGSVL